jgi:cytochrome c
MRSYAILAAALAVFVPQVVTAQDATTIARGRTQFARCQACHSTGTGPARIGPSLKGVVNRPAGSQAGFRYTPNMKAGGFNWTREKLDAFIAKPRGVVPGTSMVFAGIPDPAARAALIAYLETQK